MRRARKPASLPGYQAGYQDGASEMITELVIAANALGIGIEFRPVMRIDDDGERIRLIFQPIFSGIRFERTASVQTAETQGDGNPDHTQPQ